MMQLLALRCPNCTQKLEPQSNEAVVTSCPQCATAVTLHQTGLQPTDITYAAPAAAEVDAWLPFWVYHGRVHIQRRESQGSSKGADKDAAQLWARVQQLYVPAWEIPVPQAREMGSQLVQKQPTFQTIERPDTAHIVEAIITPEDGHKMLDFIVLTIEARRKDMLRNLKFEVKTTASELWAIPGQQKGNNWRLVA